MMGGVFDFRTASVAVLEAHNKTIIHETVRS